ncbi:hypothetical protein ACFSKU_00365 [Pontibacter silvestris]|uniref:STAS/SEC14 domain-containing protein n=1 Tax=Pontibacter silvestris TaxID=2305183 RepID=A0ABW4WU30_9BACT|nr:hypothetical protein [Pontibacter silvestris]MCC9138183.1 hypothetical protein [Pontibacter silvestris]
MIIKELSSSTGKPYLIIEYNQKNNWIYNNWDGYVTKESVVTGSLAVLKAFESYHTPYGLNDNSNLVGRWDHAITWIEEVWMPRAAAAGLRYYAHVVDKESFAAASSEEMIKRTKRFFQMCSFDNITDAQAWLKECQKAVKEAN